MGNSESSPSTPAPAAAAALARPRSSTFRRIPDEFNSLGAVQEALQKAGLESSNLIVAIDFTKSNEWTGKASNYGRSLHAITPEVLNPYELVITIIGRTLSAFDDDGLIPCYGFGDSSTSDKRVFAFKPNDEPCRGLEEVQAVYRAITPHVRLAGPTSFAPAIHQAIKLVAESGGQFHILLLVADGQVTRPSHVEGAQLSEQEQATVDAIVEASKWPLSIIMIGVGDGPWDAMKQFDDMLPQRAHDNFQFCCATDIFKDYAGDVARLEACFALNALMEVPQQFKAIQRLRLLGRGAAPPFAIPPPLPCPCPLLPAPHPGYAAAAATCGAPSAAHYPQAASFHGSYGSASWTDQAQHHERPSAPPALGG